MKKLLLILLCLPLLINAQTTKKVLIIGIDGFRTDAMQESITPFLYQLSESSTTFYNGLNNVEDYTMSGPNWSSLVTGVHWCKHQVTNNSFNDNQLNDFPHFFSNFLICPPKCILKFLIFPQIFLGTDPGSTAKRYALHLLRRLLLPECSGGFGH